MPEEPTVGIGLQEVFLANASFRRLGAHGGEEKVDFNLSLGAGLSDSDTLVVEFGAEATVEDKLRAKVDYRALFALGALGVQGEEREKQIRFFAARVAPTVLYPYVRETLTNLSAKAGMPPLLPPIINFGAMFDPNEIILDVLADEPEGRRDTQKEEEPA